jgi:hypothetical protein
MSQSAQSITGTGAGLIKLANVVVTNQNAFANTLNFDTTEGIVSPFFQYLNKVLLITGAVDPTAGAGVAAAQGSIFQRTNGGVGTTLYAKTGATNTSWTAFA